EEIEHVLASHEHDQAVHRPLSAEETRRRIREIRRAGHAMAADEAIDGVSSLAVPIYDGAHRVIAALSVSGPSERLTRDRMEATLSPLRTAGRAISARLGASDIPAEG